MNAVLFEVEKQKGNSSRAHTLHRVAKSVNNIIDNLFNNIVAIPALFRYSPVPADREDFYAYEWRHRP